MRPYDDDGILDPDEWSADIAELFCSYSAVVRLGARLVFGVEYLPVPATELSARYLPMPVIEARRAIGPAAAGANLAQVAGSAQGWLGRRRALKPNKRELVVQVAVRDSLLGGVARYPEVASALKEDLARALVAAADAAFLHGRGGPAPHGIAYALAGVAPTDNDPLGTARTMITQLRNVPNVRFDNPGWVIDVRTLDVLTTLLTKSYLERARDRYNSRTLDSNRLLMLDGDDCGVLLGYPFVATTAAQEGNKSRMYFSSDWSEAWVGIDQDLVTVDVSTETEFRTDQTVLRAVMHHDFVVRTPSRFVYTRPFAPV